MWKQQRKVFIQKDIFSKEEKIETITLTLQKNIFSKDELEISFDDVETIGEYILLNKEINTDQVEESETVEVEVIVAATDLITYEEAYNTENGTEITGIEIEKVNIFVEGVRVID